MRDGIIEAVGTELAKKHPAEPVCDLGEAALLPGFVNAHSHIEMTASRGKRDGVNLWEWLDAEAYRPGRVPSPEMLEAAALVGAIESALSGITYLADSSFSGAAARAMDAVGLRGTVYLEVFGQRAGDKCAEVFLRKLDEAREIQRRLGPRVRTGISPHSIYTSGPEMLRLCAEACENEGLPVAMHLSETDAEIEYALNGVGPIAYMRRRMGYEPMVTGARPARYLHEIGLLRPGVCLAHCVHLMQEEIELISRSGVGVAHCPRSNAYLGAGIAPIKRLLAAGANLGLGTDGAGTCLTYDFFEEMRFAFGLSRAAAKDASVLTAKEILKQATLGSAEAVGAADEVGSLEPGKCADLVAVDLSSVLPGEDVHLAVAAKSPSDVKLVVVGGKEVVKNGVPTMVELEECRKTLRGLMERRGIG